MITPSHAEIAALRSQLWQNGYRPVAVYTQGKRPFGNAWQERARQNPPGAVTEPVNGAALSTGILCDGLRAIDIDVDDPVIASEVERIAYGILGTCPARRRADSARALLLYRAASGEPCKRTVEGTLGSVEVLGHGQQFVAFGTHEHGQEYTWAVSPAPYSVTALTAITEEALTDFLAAVGVLIGALVVSPAQTAPADLLAAPVDPARITESDRAYAQAALLAEYETLCKKTQHRNNALNNAANALGEFVGAGLLDEQQVILALSEASAMNGYEAKDGKAAVMKTVYSGLASGKTKPRPLPSQSVPLLNPALWANLEARGRVMNPTISAPIKRTVKLLRGSDIETRNVEWIWKGFLPRGMLTLLGGDAGTGKSTLAFSLAATVTVGGTWPDGSRLATAGNVLIWSGEDSAQLTIAPRMIAAGCSPDRYGVIEGVTNEHGESLSFDPAQDVPLLRQTAQSIGGISLLIIDPLISAVAGDAHRANEVRRYLQPIVDLADELNCAVIGIHHHAKNSAGRDAVSRMLGSQAFTALARMVMQTVRVKDTDTRIVAISKSNITLDRGGFSYTIEPVALSNGVSTTVVRWGVAVEGTAQNIIDDAEGVGRESRPLNRVSEAEQFLHEELKNSPRNARELIELAKNQLNISERTLQRAKEKMGIQAVKTGMNEGWVWTYPFKL
jgi:putative DNA primase/helicase